MAGWTQLARQLCLGPLESWLFLRGCHLKELVFILWCLPGRPGHFDNHCAAIQRAILRFFFFFSKLGKARSKFLLELYTREESHLADRIQSDSCSAGRSWREVGFAPDLPPLHSPLSYIVDPPSEPFILKNPGLPSASSPVVSSA